VPLDGFFAAAARNYGSPFAQLGDERQHSLSASLESLLVPLDPRPEQRHETSLTDARNTLWASANARHKPNESLTAPH
jgi:hypothetical protein